MPDLAEDYRTLLADGIVVFPWEHARLSWKDDRNWEEDHRRWGSKIATLAAADGLRASLFYMHSPMLEWMDEYDLDPCVALQQVEDHSREPGPNIYPYDQHEAAAWHRPRAEAKWGETLIRARREAGVSVVDVGQEP